jgi:hypothetical protein
LIEKFTVPGVPELAVPLGLSRLSHGEPGSAVAVQFAVEFPFMVTSNDPAVFPGALPAVDWNCIPAGASVMIEPPEINSETGTLTGPAAELIVM